MRWRKERMALSIKGSAFYFGDQVDAPEASFSNFFQWIKEQATPDRQWPFHVGKKKADEYTRQLFFDFNDDYWFGVFISAKTNEFQHYVKKVDGKVIIEAQAVKGNPPVEMNFFCIRRDTCKALFSHYVGSYQFNTFVGDLWAHYRHFVEIQKAKAIKDQKEKEAEEKKRGEKKRQKELIKTFSLNAKCNWSPLFDPTSFEAMLDKLRRIEVVRLTTYETDSPDDEPVKSRVNTVHKTYRFSMAEEVDTTFRRWIRDMRAGNAVKTKAGKDHYSGSILGMDEEGNDVFINFGHTMKNFLKYDYDKLGTFSVDDLFSHDIIKEMIVKMNDGILFGATTRN